MIIDKWNSKATQKIILKWYLNRALGRIQKIELRGGGGNDVMVSDSEPIMAVWGRSPLVGGLGTSSPRKLKTFKNKINLYAFWWKNVLKFISIEHFYAWGLITFKIMLVLRIIVYKSLMLYTVYIYVGIEIYCFPVTPS